MSARDALLDAYEAILIDEGARAATLEAVASRAGVSKGGLLYHFRSKEALAEGLLARLEELAAQDRELMRAAPEGPARYYVRSSVWTGSAFDRACIAVAQLAQASTPAARDVMVRMGEAWLELLVDELGDPAVSRAILLMGDGLYYDAALVGGSEVPAPGSSGSLEDLLEVVDHLVELARARRGGS